MTLEAKNAGRVLMVCWLVAATAVVGLPEDQTASGEKLPETVSPLHDSFREMTGEELLAKLLEHNRLRDLRLAQYCAVRTYEAKNSKGKLYAQQTVVVSYKAPDTKIFRTTSESGSWAVRSLVFRRLIESEVEAAAGQLPCDSALKPANYSLTLIGEQDVGPYHCLVAEAVPKRKDKYLFEGRVWIEAQDFAVVRVAGSPAKKLSFWISRADFVRQFQKIGEFWLPYKDETFVEMKLYGRMILTIDHRDYTVNGRQSDHEDAQNLAREGQPVVH